MKARRARPLISAIALASTVLALAPDPAIASCPELVVNLAGFPVPNPNPTLPPDVPFYYVPENGDVAEFLIFPKGHLCTGQTGQLDYQTSPDSATNTPVVGDYADPVPNPGTVTYTSGNPQPEPVEFSINDDATEDSVGAEVLTVRLQNARGSENMGLVAPTSAPYYIVDDEGASRATFIGGPLSVPEYRDGPVRVPLLLAGALDSTVQYHVSPDPSEYISSPADGDVAFSPNGRLGTISLNPVDDTLDEPDKTFTVMLTGVGTQGQSSFQVTVRDNDTGGGGGDQLAPATSFHHPKHGDRLARGSFRADTIHAFVAERPDHDVEAIDWARLGLRKKMTNNNCLWWGGNSWQGGPCGEPEWLQPTEAILQYSSTKALYTYTEYPSLRPSQGTNIKSYTVYVRASDVVGNVSQLEIGQSVNTFEVVRN